MKIIISEKSLRRKIKMLMSETTSHFQTQFRAGRTEIDTAKRAALLKEKAGELSKKHKVSTVGQGENTQTSMIYKRVKGKTNNTNDTFNSWCLICRGEFYTGKEYKPMKLVLPVQRVAAASPTTGRSTFKFDMLQYNTPKSSLNNILFFRKKNDIESLWLGISTEGAGVKGKELAKEKEGKSIFFASILLFIENKIESNTPRLMKKTKKYLKDQGVQPSTALNKWNSFSMSKIKKQYDYLAELGGYAEDTIQSGGSSGKLDLVNSHVSILKFDDRHFYKSESRKEHIHFEFWSDKSDPQTAIDIILPSNAREEYDGNNFIDKIRTNKRSINLYHESGKRMTNTKEKNNILDFIIKQKLIPPNLLSGFGHGQKKVSRVGGVESI